MPIGGITTLDGHIYKAELFFGADGTSSPESARGPFWCAIGDGDLTFTNPLVPPAEDANQTGLKHEKIRKKFTTKNYVVIDSVGPITVGDTSYSISVSPTGIVLLEYVFDFSEANFTWKEVAFFGGSVVFGQFYNSTEPPVVSGISGITINFVSPENGTGTGTLAFTVSGTTLTWKAPGSSTAGPSVNIGGGGDFQLQDGDDATKKIRVVVAAGSLPGINASVTPTIGAPATVVHGGLNSSGNPAGQVASNGRLYIVRNIQDQLKDSSTQRPERLLLRP